MKRTRLLDIWKIKIKIKPILFDLFIFYFIFRLKTFKYYLITKTHKFATKVKIHLMMDWRALVDESV